MQLKKAVEENSCAVIKMFFGTQQIPLCLRYVLYKYYPIIANRIHSNPGNSNSGRIRTDGIHSFTQPHIHTYIRTKGHTHINNEVTKA